MVSLISIEYELFNLQLIICLHTVYCFQELLCIINNSIKHQSFVYTQLNDQTVLLLTIQFSMSTKLNSSKYFNVTLTIQLKISDLHTVKCSKISILNN